ncbi:hypothetical protein L3Q82_026599, partial [Scortum barcoo]
MVDVAADLSSFSFESGLTEEEKDLLHLRARAAGLAFCGCAHAAFVCHLLRSLRCAIKSRPADGDPSGDLRVGILGMGHMGKQLLLSLLDKSSIKPSHIKISTRRPESAAEFSHREVECFFDNGRLAAWADILFLCCLPSHLPRVCADLRSCLSKRCLIYSFASAVPVTRLALLLEHDFVLKPQYEFLACDSADVWLSCAHVSTASTDPLLIEASCPLTMSSGISLGLNWVCAVLYSLLNFCTSAGLKSSDALCLINSLLKVKKPHTGELNAQSFVNASHASSLQPE